MVSDEHLFRFGWINWKGFWCVFETNNSTDSSTHNHNRSRLLSLSHSWNVFNFEIHVETQSKHKQYKCLGFLCVETRAMSIKHITIFKHPSMTLTSACRQSEKAVADRVSSNGQQFHRLNRLPTELLIPANNWKWNKYYKRCRLLFIHIRHLGL